MPLGSMILAMFEADYWHGGQLRWNFWFTNPNHAGALVAMALGGWLGWRSAWAAVAGPGLAQGAHRPKWLSCFIGTLLLAIEFGGWWVLCKTYSRGALVAVLGATLLLRMLVSGMAQDSAPSRTGQVAGWCRRWWLAPGCRWWLVRIGMLGLCLWLSGLGTRVTPDELGSDASVGNRAVLWHAGARMVAASPVQGWGEGRSGAVFEEWFQPLERRERYRTMVSSWLTLAVERGLPSTCLLLVLLTWPWWFTWLLARTLRQSRSVVGDGPHQTRTGEAFWWALQVCLVSVAWAGALAHLFSTLSVVPLLLWTPVLASVAALGLAWFRWWWFRRCQAAPDGATRCRKRTHRWSAPLVSFALAVTMAAVPFVLALAWPAGWRSDDSGLRVTQVRGDWLCFTTHASERLQGAAPMNPHKLPSSDLLHHWWPDPLVLGDQPGRALRRLAAELPDWQWRAPVDAHAALDLTEVLNPAWVSDAMSGPAHWHWLCGTAAASWCARASALQPQQLPHNESERRPATPAQIVLVHPAAPAPGLLNSQDRASRIDPSLSSRVVAVVVPEWEVDWWSPLWEQWATDHGIPVIYSQGSAVNIEAALLQVVKDVTTSAKW